MSVYIWASIYILIELLKYYLCLDVVFNIPIYKRKITVPIWLAASFVICILYFSFYQYEGIFYLLPVLCFAAIFFAIENKNKLKGILFMILSWIVIDSLSELMSQLIAVISGRNDYLLIGFTVNQFIEKFVVLFILVLSGAVGCHTAELRRPFTDCSESGKNNKGKTAQFAVIYLYEPCNDVPALLIPCGNGMAEPYYDQEYSDA